MEIYPVACESLGTRSFAQYIITDSAKILIDPSVSLGPTRFGLKPQPIEIAASWISRKTIMTLSETADVLIQSHYHGDHFTLGVPRVYEFTNEEIFKTIYQPGVVILAKDHTDYINRRQKKRAQWLWKNKELQLSKADSGSFEIGSTQIVFSPPVPHGADGTRGYVVEVMIKENDESYIYTSDVCGPSSKEATDFILENSPQIVSVDGVPFYLSKSEEYLANAFSNLSKIVDEVKEVYIDHHFLRSLDWKKTLKERIGKTLPTFSMLRNQKPFLLEAMRKQIYQQSKPSEEFYEEFESGEYSIAYFRELLHKNRFYQYWKNLLKDIKKSVLSNNVFKLVQ